MNLRHNFRLAVNAIVRMHYMGCSVSGERKHCNLGSKKVLPTDVLHTQLLTYLLTHNVFSSCIRRYLVSRACD